LPSFALPERQFSGNTLAPATTAGFAVALLIGGGTASAVEQTPELQGVNKLDVIAGRDTLQILPALFHASSAADLAIRRRVAS
jgi:hypothetical protein